MNRIHAAIALLSIVALLEQPSGTAQVNRDVPYRALGPLAAQSLFGIPIVQTPDTTADAEKGVFPGKGWRVINTGTLPLLLDRLPYLDLPHQEWAKPYHGGKLRVLYVNSTYEIGEASMLEQRGDLECSIYCVPVYLDWYGDWQKDATFVAFLERRMRELLALDPDIIIVNGAMAGGGNTSEGSKTLPPSVHEMVLGKVKAGAGLVLIPSTATKVSSDRFDVFSQASPLRYKSYTARKNVFRGTHPIVDGVPMEVVNPAYYLVSDVAESAEVPVKLNDQPFLGLGNYGNGRVVAFGYAGQKSIPDHAGYALQYREQVDQRLLDEGHHWYEYGYSMLIKAALWAGKKEPRVAMQTEGAKDINQEEPVAETVVLKNHDQTGLPLTLTATVRNSDYETVAEKKTDVNLTVGDEQRVKLELGDQFRNGLHLVDIVVRNRDGQVENWGSATFTVVSPVTVEVQTDKPFYQTSDKVRLTTKVETAEKANLTLRTELWDTYGRLMQVAVRPIPSGQTTCTDTIELSLANAVANVFDIRTFVLQETSSLVKRTDEIAIPRHGWDADWHNKMWSVSGFQQDAVFKAIGIDDMTGATYAHRLGTLRLNARGNFGQHPWSCGPHPSHFYAKDASDDQHHPPVLDPEWKAQEEKNIREAADAVRKYGVAAMSLSGEFVCYYDSSYDSLTLKAFNQYLQKKYQNLDALNAQWGTWYANWAEVGPINTADWREKKTRNFSQWMEFRRFMDRTLTDAHTHSADVWRKAVGRPIHIGQEQTFGLWQHTIPYGGFDYYGMLSRGLDCWTSYAGGDSGLFYRPIPFHTEFEWLLLTSWCKGRVMGIGGWASGGLEGWGLYDGRSWSVLFNGGSGMDWYEPSMFTAGYTALLPGGAAIYRATHEIKSGIGKALLTAQRQTDPVAVWQDMTNEYAGWLLTGPVCLSRWDLIKNLSAHGIKPIGVSDQQVESGLLIDRGIKLLYMPHIVCVSRKAADHVRQFVESGGTVIADYGVGAFDEWGKPLERGFLDEVFGVSRSELKKMSGNAVPVLSETTPAFSPPLGEYPCSSDSEFPINYREGDLRVTTGKALGTVSKQNHAQGFILNRCGRGNALLFNFFSQGFSLPDDKSGGVVQERWFQFAGAILKLAGVAPQVQVTAGNKPLKFFDVNRFKRGGAWYVGVLRYPDEVADSIISTGGGAHAPRTPGRTAEPEAVSISMPARGHMYELRSHRYLGQHNIVNDSFKVGDLNDAVKVYAVLPYPVQGVRLAAPRQGKRSAVLDYSVAVVGADGSADHAIRIEVVNPQGRFPEAYQKKVVALKGKFQGRLPLALNDLPGAWVIKATDIISGKSTTAQVQVTK